MTKKITKADDIDDGRTTRALSHIFCMTVTNKGEKVRTFTDTVEKGLIFRVYEDQKTWSLRFKGTKKKFGTFIQAGLDKPVLPLAEARALAKTYRGIVLAGGDPFAAAAPVEKGADINDLIEKRLAREVRGKMKTKKLEEVIEKRYLTYIGDVIGTVAILDFDGGIHHEKVVGALLDRGVNSMAIKVHNDLSCLFGFAVGKFPGVKYNLMSGVKVSAKDTKCERHLDVSELRTWWNNIDDAVDVPAIARVLKLEALTGQRTGQIAGMRRCELDLDDEGEWTIPAARCKNGRDHVIPVSAQAEVIIREAMADTDAMFKADPSMDFLFPMQDRKTMVAKPQTAQNIATKLFDIRTAHARALQAGLTKAPFDAFGVAYWTAHDLRRTLSTLSAEFVKTDNGDTISQVYIDKVLSHTDRSSPGVARIYNRYDYINEKRELLEKWGALVEMIVNGGEPAKPKRNKRKGGENVVQLRAVA